MLLPLSTDAPVYHFPGMTIGLIGANFIGFLLTSAGNPEQAEKWAHWSLQYGNGLNPIQWITSNFVHMGLIHLIGNMVFLWTFGLVVEGKLGWWKFLLVYLSIGFVQCGMEQTIMLGHDQVARYVDQELAMFDRELAMMDADELAEMKADGVDPKQLREQRIQEVRAEVGNNLPGSCGASAIIYGLMAISMVWAPVNEIKCFVMIGFRAAVFDISIMVFAAIDIGFQFVFATLSLFSIATATLHLMGAFVGLIVGIVLLKRGVIDGEDWDLFSVLSGHYGPYARDKYGNRITKEEKEKADRKEKEKFGLVKSKTPKAPPVDEDMRNIGELIDDGLFEEASDEFWALRVSKNVHFTKPRLNQLIAGLLEQECWEDAASLMEEYIERFPDTAAKMQLPLARIQVTKTGEPYEAKQTLKDVDKESLNEKQLAMYKKLVKAVKAKLS